MSDPGDDRPARMWAPWTPTEDRILDWHFGEEPVKTTAERLQRTPAAIRWRRRQRYGTSSVVQGRETFDALARRTGYNWGDIKRACTGAGVKPKRTGGKARGRKNLLDEEQVERVLAWLASEPDPRDGRKTPTEVASAAGCSRAKAFYVARRLGLPKSGRLGLAPGDAEVLRCALDTTEDP